MLHEPQTGIPSNQEPDWPRACHCAIKKKNKEPESPQRPAKSHQPQDQPHGDRSAVCTITGFRREVDKNCALLGRTASVPVQGCTLPFLPYVPLYILHLSSPSVPSRQVTGRTSPLLSLLHTPFHGNPTSGLAADTKSQTVTKDWHILHRRRSYW